MPAETDTPTWGMPDAAICFVVGTAVAVIAVSAVIGAGNDEESLATTAASLIGLWVGLLGSMWLVWRAKGGGSFAGDFGLRLHWPRDVIGLPIGIAMVGVNVILYAPFAQFIDDFNTKLDAPAQKLADQAGHGVGLAILAVLVIVGAPIVEEVFYRGLLLRAVQRRFGDRVAIGASAVVFAGAHFELLQFPALLALGIVLGVLAVRRGRIGAGIVAHAGFNSVAIVMLALQNH